MIVVAIIGILAAIAIPAYQDYTIRSKVSEGMVLASAARTAVAETFIATGTLPGDNATAGLSNTIASKYVTSVVVGGSGVITVTLDASLDPAVAGSTITFVPEAITGVVDWDCTGGSLVSKYRTANCR